MLIVIKILITIAMVIIVALWEYCGSCPALGDIRLATMNDDLKAHPSVSYGPGISVQVSGQTFIYCYDQEWIGGAVATRLRITFRKRMFGKPKIVLIATFRDDDVEKWSLADGKEHTSPNYPDWYALRDILKKIKDAPRLRHVGERI